MGWDRYEELIALADSGKPEEALRGLVDLERNCSDDEDRVLVLLSIWNCLALLKRYAEAGQMLKKAFALVGKQSPLYPRIAFKDAYGDIYLRNWKKALDKFDGILRKSGDILNLPENDDLPDLIRAGRGIVLEEMGRFRDALPLLKEAARAEPEDGVLQVYLGACRFGLKEFQQSRECFLRALELDLDSSYRYQAHFFLGSIHYAQGNFAWAKQEFEKALEYGEASQFSGKNIYEFLRLASQSLGLQSEVERYSRLQRQIARPSKALK